LAEVTPVAEATVAEGTANRCLLCALGDLKIQK